MFASLVVVFPTRHEGGSVMLHHDGEEWTFDSATMLLQQDLPSMAYVAFYSDVDHEVTTVNSGYRVTLTYNLYLDKVQPTLPPSISPIDSGFHAALSNALQDPTFLPKGGLLGFGLSFQYPVDPSTSMANLDSELKGSDAVIKRVCDRLGLDISLKAIYQEKNDYLREYAAMLDEIVEVPYKEEVEDNVITLLQQDNRGKLIYDTGTKAPTDYRGRQIGDSVNVMWVTPLTKNAHFQSPYVRYGNQATLSYVYGDVCLIVKVKEWDKRKEV